MATTNENMKRRIEPLGLYNIAVTTELHKELATYGYFMDKEKKQADNLLKEVIITTAEDYGLEMMEKIWGIPRTELTTEERRLAIEKRFAINYSDCTLKGMLNFLSSLGLSAEITEAYEKERVYIHITNGSGFTYPVKKYMSKQIEEFFPAHLEIYIDYRTIDWDGIDQKLTMFNTYDSFNLTWDRLEHFE